MFQVGGTWSCIRGFKSPKAPSGDGTGSKLHVLCSKMPSNDAVYVKVNFSIYHKSR